MASSPLNRARSLVLLGVVLTTAAALFAGVATANVGAKPQRYQSDYLRGNDWYFFDLRLGKPTFDAKTSKFKMGAPGNVSLKLGTDGNDSPLAVGPRGRSTPTLLVEVFYELPPSLRTVKGAGYLLERTGVDGPFIRRGFYVDYEFATGAPGTWIRTGSTLQLRLISKPYVVRAPAGKTSLLMHALSQPPSFILIHVLGAEVTQPRPLDGTYPCELNINLELASTGPTFRFVVAAFDRRGQAYGISVRNSDACSRLGSDLFGYGQAK